MSLVQYTALVKPLSKKQLLRKQLRKSRLALSRRQQQAAAIGLDRNIAQSGLFQRRGSVALYFANDGEIDPVYLMSRLLKYQRQCYFPVVFRNGTLRFARYRAGDKLIKNSFGIPEPARQSKLRKPWTIGTILMPLVGFDRCGGRLGMGGGFYDRSFKNASAESDRRTKTPRLVGLAHHTQEVDFIPLDNWDIGMSVVATDCEVIFIPTK